MTPYQAILPSRSAVLRRTPPCQTDPQLPADAPGCSCPGERGTCSPETPVRSRRLFGACVLGAVLLIVGCGEDATAPRPVDPAISSFTSPNDSLAKLVRQLTAARGITAQRQPRHLLHDLPPPGARHQRRAEPVGRPGRHRTRSGAHASHGRLHPAQRAATLQSHLARGAVLGRAREPGRARRLPHAGRRAPHQPDDPQLRFRRALGAGVVPGPEPRRDAGGRRQRARRASRRPAGSHLGGVDAPAGPDSRVSPPVRARLSGQGGSTA